MSLSTDIDKKIEESNEKDIRNLINSNRWDYDAPIISSEVLLYQSNNIILRRGNFSCVVGRAKSRKTFFIGAIVGALYKGSYMGFSTKDNKASNLKILYLDTEQDKGDAAESFKRIEKISNQTLAPCIFCGITLRHLSVKERIKVLEQAAEEEKPDIIVIDGITDLMINPNDLIESSDVYNLLMNLTSKHNSHIINVIHINEGGSSEKARGHIGSDLIRKSEIVISLKKEDDKTLVTFPQSRKSMPEKFYFFINNDGIPELYDYVPTEKISREDMLKTLFSRILKINKTLRHSTLINDIISNTNKKRPTAKKYISEAIELGIIKHDPVSGYSLNINTNIDDDI